jgi:hypothetical protein
MRALAAAAGSGPATPDRSSAPSVKLPTACSVSHSSWQRRLQPVVHGRRLKPRYVLWGEGTTDEMCLGLLEVADR